MEYTWLGKKGYVEVQEKYPGKYEAAVLVDGQAYSIGEVEKRDDGQYTAICDGYFYPADTIEKSLMQPLKIKEEQAASRQANIKKSKKTAAARQKRKLEEAERREAFM